MKTDDVGFVNGEKITGSGTQTLSADNDDVNEGYYAETTLSAVDTDLVAANIKCGETIFGVTGTLTPGCVAKTGQTTSYYTGDDGAERKGCEPAVDPSGFANFGNYSRADVATPYPGFTDNEDGTVTDNLTCLVWLKNVDCFGGIRTWTEALGDCNTLADDLCGLSDGSVAGDWRLPNANEARSLFDPNLSSPYLPGGHPFSGAPGGAYWTSSTYTGHTNSAWYVQLGRGEVGYENKSKDGGHVWPVRSGN